jgi:hypothetical protein
MNRRQPVVSLLQASQNNPGLAKLLDIHRGSNDRLKSITPLIPATLRAEVQAGPIEDGVWCLLLTNSTMAAKLRQLLPAFEAHLKTHGLDVKSIRLKVIRPA